MTRREFLFAAAAGASAGFPCLVGCKRRRPSADTRYSVAILGDTHYDAEPESVYHSHYDESNKWAKIQHAEFVRNGEMWRERCPRMLAASAELAHGAETSFVLQLGDVIQGDCDDVPTHKKMLDDCIRMLRAPYPKDLPFLTVMGNHDFRGKGARQAYLEFAEPFMSGEIERLSGVRSAKAEYPVFSFRLGADLWVFCDFETKDLGSICDALESDPGARHVFLVTHGPFTTFAKSASRWRLGGGNACDATRPRLYETLSRRHAVVLSGHTHTTNFYRHENRFGGFSEFTVNSVWSRPELATAEPIHDKPSDYASEVDGKPKDRRGEIEFFCPGLTEYFYNDGAGHYRMDVSDKAVTMAFYPGDAREPARTFALKK